MPTLILGALLAWLSGCTIGTPWPNLPAMSAEHPGERVVLVLTRVVVDTSQRHEFDLQNSRVLASMGSHRGLIGYAARRELFGGQGWTMSVWASDEARRSFMQSPVHRDAITRSMPALQAAELKRMTVARKDLPAGWDDVLRMLANPDGRRNYWE